MENFFINKIPQIVDKKFINGIVENSADAIVDKCETISVKQFQEPPKRKRKKAKKAEKTVKKWERITTNALKTSKKWV